MATLMKIDQAVGEMMQEVMNETLDKLLDYLTDRVELTEEIRRMFEEYREVMYVPENIWEKKRRHTPSEYNLFIKNKILELKAAGFKGNLMKMAVEAWKTKPTTA